MHLGYSLKIRIWEAEIQIAVDGIFSSLTIKKVFSQVQDSIECY